MATSSTSANTELCEPSPKKMTVPESSKVTLTSLGGKFHLHLFWPSGKPPIRSFLIRPIFNLVCLCPIRKEPSVYSYYLSRKALGRCHRIETHAKQPIQEVGLLSKHSLISHNTVDFDSYLHILSHLGGWACGRVVWGSRGAAPGPPNVTNMCKSLLILIMA